MFITRSVFQKQGWMSLRVSGPAFRPPTAYLIDFFVLQENVLERRTR